MDKNLKNVVADTIAAVIDRKARKVITFLSPKLVVKAANKVFGGKLSRGNDELVVTIGKPNYEERVIVKKLKRLHVKYPFIKVKPLK